MFFEAQTGEYQVVGSGILHLLEDEVATLSLKEEGIITDSPTIEIRLSFIEKLIEGTQSDESKISVEWKTVNNNKAELIITNCKGSLGYGNTKPFQIGEIANQKLYLTFRTSSLNDASLRTFEYTLYKK